MRKETAMNGTVIEVMETAKSYNKSEKSNKNPEKDQKNDEFTYEIKEHIGVLRTSAGGWTKELNLVSWNGKPVKYDLREWSEDHKKMSRGVTLTKAEAKVMFHWLSDRDFSKTDTDEEDE